MQIARRLFSPGVLVGLAVVMVSSQGCGSSSGNGASNSSSSSSKGDDGTGADGGTTGTTGGGGSVFAGSDGGASGGDGSVGSVGADGTPQCTSGGQCVHACASGSAPTSISGTVYDPAGKNPLYGVVVYVPSQAPTAIRTGASCYSCGDLYTGSPIAFSVTDAAGHFSITNVPDGASVPLVVQIGKWRKQMVVPTVSACADTALPDKSVTLPKNHTEGDIPSIAIATGGADTLECLLGRIGLDATEYGPGGSGPGIHIFVGDGGSNTSPAAPVASQALWDSQADLMNYDILLLTCEGHETTKMNQQALYDYANDGGRVFASHYHYAWLDTGPFGSDNLAQWKTGSNDIGNVNGVVQTTLPGGQAFPRGEALASWLGNVGALTNGELPIQQARHNADVSATNVASLPWIAADPSSSAPGATEYFSFDTPIGADAGGQCGRVVYSDLHVGAASQDYGWDGSSVPSNAVVPTGCANNDLSPQEKALEFMLFDLSACITPPAQGAGGIIVQ